MGLGNFHTLATKPAKGAVTWDSEGTEGGRYHSRKLHVPSTTSGLTIGRGYDMAHRNAGQIAGDLMKAGVSKEDAQKIAKSAGKTGKSAKDFIAENDLGDVQISQAAQLKLFQISYDHEAKEVRRISSKDDTVKKYGAVDWDGLDQNIKDIVVDLKFRGDYTSASRQKIQKHVAANDLKGLAREICDKSNWPNVPKDRFERRKTMMEKAVSELEKREKATNRGGTTPAAPVLHLGKTPPATKHKGIPA